MHAILWDPSEPEATRPLGLTTSDGAHYSYGHDFTKNVTEMLDETGRLVASYEYDPYGRTVIESGSCAHANPLGFSSEITDRETGTMYYNYRDYNPTDGRWLTRDPIGERGGHNLYGFVKNNSSRNIDRLGYVTIATQPGNRYSNCLGYAMTGRVGVAKTPIDQGEDSFIEALKKEKWNCIKIKEPDSCQCKNSEHKMIIILYKNNNPENKDIDPWESPKFIWQNKDIHNVQTDYHAIRAEDGDSNDYNEQPGFDKTENSKSDIISDSTCDLLGNKNLEKICCCQCKK